LCDRTTCQALKDKIKKNIDSAAKRRLPLVATTLTNHCNTISENIMALLNHYLSLDRLNLGFDESRASNITKEGYNYRSNIKDKLATLFVTEEDKKLDFSNRQELKNILDIDKLWNIPHDNCSATQPFDDTPSTSNPLPASDILDWMTPFFVIMSNLQRNEFYKLKDVNEEYLTQISEIYDEYFDEVSNFVAKLNLGNDLLEKFKNAGIIPSLFNQLTKEILDNAGITKPGEQQVILKAAHEYTESFKCSTVVELEEKVSQTKKQKDHVEKMNAIMQEEIQTMGEEKGQMKRKIDSLQEKVDTTIEQKEEMKKDMIIMQKKMRSMISMQNSLNSLQTDVNAIMNKYLAGEEDNVAEKQINQSDEH